MNFNFEKFFLTFMKIEAAGSFGELAPEDLKAVAGGALPEPIGLVTIEK